MLHSILIDFWSILVTFWVELGSQNRSKIDQIGMLSRCSNHMLLNFDFRHLFGRILYLSWHPQHSKNIKKPSVFVGFWDFRLMLFGTLLHTTWTSNSDQFWSHFGCKKGSKSMTKWIPKCCPFGYPFLGAILALKINSGPQLGFFQAPSWRLELTFRGINEVNLG